MAILAIEKFAFKAALRRFGRSALLAILLAMLAKYKSDPRYLALLPFIQALAKYIRDKFGIVLPV